MSNIRLITDSTADLPRPLADGVTVLPMTIRFGSQEYKDGETISHDEFYNRLIESDELPETSLVAPGDFAKAYEQYVNEGQDVLVITVSSKLSGTYQSATIAAEDYPGKVYVVDSLNATIGEQVLVQYAYQLIQEGKSIQEIVEILEEKKHHIHLVALLDTLEYLKKGGRISSSVAFIGGMLSIKPVISVEDGEIKFLGSARGSKNGNNFLVKEINKTNGVDFSMPVILGYTGLSDAMLQKYIKDSQALWQDHIDELSIATIGAAIGTHAGPNAFAVAFFSK